jgi:hypothetical protein
MRWSGHSRPELFPAAKQAEKVAKNKDQERKDACASSFSPFPLSIVQTS